MLNAWSHSMSRQQPIDDAVFPDEHVVHGSRYMAHHDRGKHVGAVPVTTTVAMQMYRSA